ncbi:Hypothetical predicted protein [Olea europaea subsp. europaea]|uniref:Uncharacterized protein n=1 Tax=Olea europaea subsp. europaea TaxID=158383 RepID=A0A8S0R717_OLEEU|nr:Hypothetical predicted protein [Olea europaea subsp. europaea]
MKKPEEGFNKQEIIALEMAKSCKGLAMELVNCLSESDSVKGTTGHMENVPRSRTRKFQASVWD